MSSNTRVSFGLAAAAVASILLTACGQTSAVSLPGTSVRTMGVKAAARPGELVVKFRSPQARQSVMQKMQLRAVNRLDQLGVVVVKATDTTQALRALKSDASVVYAEPNYIARKSSLNSGVSMSLGFAITSGDDLLPKLWGMKMIGADDAWRVSTGRGAKIAIVDTGIDYRHRDFGQRVIDRGRDFASGKPDAMDDEGHGTHCAGTAAAGMGDGGVVGVAPDASLIAVKVLDRFGSGSYAGVAQGIVYAADAGADIVSLSLGGPGSSKVLEDAVNYTMNKGALVVAAMGNEGSFRPSYPAAVPGVMAVGATSQDDTLPSFTNAGKHISVGAPGVDILSTLPGGNYEEYSGTSMATPHVSGLAALLKSRNPGLTAGQIRRQIEVSAEDKGAPGFDERYGHGRIHAGRALR